LCLCNLGFIFAEKERLMKQHVDVTNPSVSNENDNGPTNTVLSVSGREDGVDCDEHEGDDQSE
jgi:hypothetical protein